MILTADEKREIIKKFCKGFTNTRKCEECPLYRFSDLDCYDSTDEVLIDSHYEAIVKDMQDHVYTGKYSDEELTMFDVLKKEVSPVKDPIKPDYYNDSKITPFEVIDDWSLDFYLGNAIKYIKRAGKKDNNSKVQDLKKVREYINQEIRLEEGSF